MRATSTLFVCLCWLSGAVMAADGVRHFEIAPKPLAEALMDFGAQSGAVIVAPTRLTAGKTAVAVYGQMPPHQALRQLLKGSGLEFSEGDDGTIVIVRNELSEAGARDSGDIRLVKAGLAEQTAADAPRAADKPEAPADEDAKGVPEILVKGSKILNMDIARSRDDAQPYVIFDRATLQRSGAVDINEFLKTRLTQNTAAATGNQQGGIVGNNSQVNLRGMGAGQTLILLDGRRVASLNRLGAAQQADLNGIPVSAVERIEVLPSTASGIYGGGATGGVINVILRRDYAGGEAKVTYDNTFDTDTALRRIDLSGGMNLEGGKTNVLFAASYSDSNVLRVDDRDYLTRARALIAGNSSVAALEASNSPPLGAVTNIRSTNGANLVLKDGTVLPSHRTFVPDGYRGIATDAGRALIANAGRYNLDMADSAQNAGGGAVNLLNNPELTSALVTLRRQFGPQVQAFIEGGMSDNHGGMYSSSIAGSYLLPRSSTLNPFDQDVNVRVPTTSGDGPIVVKYEERRGAAGIIVGLPRDWRASADYTYSYTRYYGEFTPNVVVASVNSALAANALEVIRDGRILPIDLRPYLDAPLISDVNTIMASTALRIAGPVGELPAGRPIVSGLLEHREEDLGDGFQGTLYFPTRSQRVNSAYLEVKLPLISARNKRAWAQELELQLAGRRDDYTVNGSPQFVAIGAPVERRVNETSSTNPTLGLRYQVIPDLMLRMSYGTGFLPPGLHQLVGTPQQNLVTYIDPRRANESVQAPGRNNGNDTLRPEDSESRSAGLVLTPRRMPGLRVSLDWTRIEKTDNIVALTGQQIVNNEALFPGRIARASPAPGDPFGVGRITFVDFTLVNVSNAIAEAFDLAVDYTFDTAAAGSFDIYAMATRQTHYLTQLLSNSPVVENVGVTTSFPLKFKANAGVNWRRRQWTAGWATRYFDSYLIADPTVVSSAVLIRDQGNGGRIDSQVYHDLFAGYVFGAPAGGSRAWLAGTEVQAGIKNVFDTEVPVDISNTTKYFSFYGDPRGISYYLTVKKNF